MNIGVIGLGVVGNAVSMGFQKDHTVKHYDKFKIGCNTEEHFKDVAYCNVIFICVPTPMQKSGKIDLTCLHEVVAKIAEVPIQDTIIIIKSTVTIGTTDALAKKYRHLNFAFNPEFLTNDNAVTDFQESSRIVIGAGIFVGDIIEELYTNLGFTCPIIRTNSRTAEMIKYACNSFLAGQITLANEINKICEWYEVDYQVVKEAAGYDERIGKNIAVPGPDGQKGFGGKCFPKDINALIQMARESGNISYLFEEIVRTNSIYRDKEITNG